MTVAANSLRRAGSRKKPLERGKALGDGSLDGLAQPQTPVHEPGSLAYHLLHTVNKNQVSFSLLLRGFLTMDFIHMH